MDELFPANQSLPSSSAYKVLARKYRPLLFQDLKGQEVLVQILRNGLRSGRLPHAFVLTGIRGVGKTTTARLLARALNCTGRDISLDVEPCGQCLACKAILEDRFIDVIEMDAASRTGIDDIREIIESARYKPVSGKYKVYIIDEVHMLSKSAFNGLLKTLEEPPEHVKFIFATTEINKVPKTVLSRCMKFDLPRVSLPVLIAHFKSVAQLEGFGLDDRAAFLISTAAEGSVRDGMSILDQAYAMAGMNVTAEIVEHMLGIGEHSNVLDLWKYALCGQVQDALSVLDTLYCAGGDPKFILQDLLSITHQFSLMQVSYNQSESFEISPQDKAIYTTLSAQLNVPLLTRLWQMYLKGLQELDCATVPLHALQMLMIRVAHVANMPTPAECLQGGASESIQAVIPGTLPIFTPQVVVPQVVVPQVVIPALCEVDSFEQLLSLAQSKKEPLMYTYLHQEVSIKHFSNGRIVFCATDSVAQEIKKYLTRKLLEWTGKAWEIELSGTDVVGSVKEKEQDQKAHLITVLATEPLMMDVLKTFPGANITDVNSNFN